MPSLTKFRNRWFSYNMYDRSYTPHEHSHGEIMRRISDIFFALREEDYLKLPPMIERDHMVTLPPEHHEKIPRL